MLQEYIKSIKEEFLRGLTSRLDKEDEKTMKLYANGSELGTITEPQIKDEIESNIDDYIHIRQVPEPIEMVLTLDSSFADGVLRALGISLFKYEEHVYPAEYLSEMDKLEAYLKRNGIEYHRMHRPRCESEEGYVCEERNQIIVNDGEERQWDAICHKGSYGYEDGLLEIMGCIVRDDYVVEGWLTAADVIERIEEWQSSNTK